MKDNKIDNEPTDKGDGKPESNNELFTKGVDLEVYTVKKDDDKPTWEREVPKPLPGSGVFRYDVGRTEVEWKKCRY